MRDLFAQVAPTPLLWGQRGTRGSLGLQSQEGHLQFWRSRAAAIMCACICQCHQAASCALRNARYTRAGTGCTCVLGHSHTGPGPNNSVDPYWPPATMPQLFFFPNVTKYCCNPCNLHELPSAYTQPSVPLQSPHILAPAPSGPHHPDSCLASNKLLSLPPSLHTWVLG